MSKAAGAATPPKATTSPFRKMTPVSIENAFDSQAFVEWFDAIHEFLGPDHCWDSGPMFEVLVGLYNAEENPKDAAEQALKDFEEWQFDLEMAIPSWDR